MRLSEAIRKGAKLRPQTHTALFLNGASCVLGAAWEGLVGKSAEWERAYWESVNDGPEIPFITETVRDALGLDEGERIPCPACGNRWRFGSLLEHLNDHHRWSREAIADYVEQIENGTIQPAHPTPEAGGAE